MFSRTMSFLSVLAWMILGSAAQEAAAPGNSDPEARAAITRILAEQQAAWNQGDVAGFMRGYWNSPELTFAGSHDFSKGWEQISDRYRQKYPDQAAMGHLEFTIVELRQVDKNAALVLGKWHLDRAQGELGGIFTLVFERFPEGWRIVHDHTS
jgi:ketosteroid isomerase-like protein